MADLPNPLSGGDLRNNLLSAGMFRPDKESIVFDTTHFNVVSLLMERMSGKPKKVETDDKSFYTPLMGEAVTIGTIATSTQSGNQVIVTFTDPLLNLFRKHDNCVVNLSANVRGVVISAAPGTVTLQAQNGSGTLLPVASFPVAGALIGQYNNHGRLSHGVPSQSETPIFSQNWVGKYRDTLKLTRDEMTSGLTWTSYKGVPMWSHAQEALFLKRVYKQLEWQLLMSQGGYDASTGTAFSKGLFESIRDPLRGGVNAPQATMFSFDDFMSFIITIGRKRNQKSVQLLALVGSGFLQTFQQFTAPFIQYAGVNNTFGGVDVKGLDVMTSTLAGVTVGFVLVPAFSDNNQTPTPTSITGLTGTIMENFCFVISTNNINSVDGMAMSPMRRTYAGQNETIYGSIRGVIEPNLIGNPALDGGSSNVFSTDEDSMTMEFLTQRGGDFICSDMGVWYVTN